MLLFLTFIGWLGVAYATHRFIIVRRAGPARNVRRRLGWSLLAGSIVAPGLLGSAHAVLPVPALAGIFIAAAINHDWAGLLFNGACVLIASAVCFAIALCLPVSASTGT